MSGSEWYNHDASSPAFHFRRAYDRVFRVIAAFDDHVRLEMLDEIERSVVGEDNDEIHALQRGQHVRTFGVGTDGARRTLEAAHRFVAVDSDDERVSGAAGSGKNVYVPGMKQVEHTIRERYAALLASSPPFRLSPCRNFRSGIPRLQSLLMAEGWK